MPSDPVEAGRKGGQSRSPAKLAAAKRNGFQPRPYDPARVAEARRTGNYDGLRCDEMVDALTPEPPALAVPQPEKEADDGTPPLEF